MRKTLEERLHSYEPLFGGWRLQGEIGSGSYARVYRVTHSNSFGLELQSALKAIEIIPEGKMENPDSLRQLVRDQYIGEVNLLGAMRGISNIVSYEDHAIMEIRDGDVLIGYDLLIRMELLKSLEEILRDGDTKIKTTEGVRRIGMDLCRGLSRCHRVGILHRDIKPKNIFRNQFGDYKLGDFGIARHLEGTMYARTRIGTELYAAPEITDKNSSRYGAKADLYSLGLVLYYIANDGCLPFITPELPRSKWHEAVGRRNSGEEIPAPTGVDASLGAVILKACAHRPEDRFASAQEMYHALQTAGRGKVVPAEREEETEAGGFDPLGYLWKQLGLSVTTAPEEQFMKDRLQRRSTERSSDGILTAHQAQKLQTRRLRFGRSSGQLILDRYREIAGDAFRKRYDLTEVVCREQVERIGERAFAECANLRRVTLKAPLQTIGSGAFLRCTKLEQGVLPHTVERIGDKAFLDCFAMKTAVISDLVTELPAQIFSGCRSLDTIRIPAGLQRIGAEAFRGCGAILRFALPDQVNWMGPRAFSGCKGLQEIRLPAHIQTIPDACFIGCTALTKVAFGQDLRYIEEQAFRRCISLQTAELPYGLLKIGERAFSDCEALRVLRIPKSVLLIGENAFEDCRKLTVLTPRGSYAWEYCRRNGVRVAER
ncbi:MAG: leucine-rich repeat protein [Eubacteriales bacterium]|nr:leucine-rich repeat protein [Eubacteriales bacterium]